MNAIFWINVVAAGLNAFNFYRTGLPTSALFMVVNSMCALFFYLYSRE